MTDKKRQSEASPDAVLPLQEWIRLLTTQGAPMRAVMVLAATAYKETNTRAKLGTLSTERINELVEEKDRKAIGNAVKALATGQSPHKKRSRDDDLLRPLGAEVKDVPTSFEFNEVRDPETLLGVNVTVNRAPIKTAWAYCVARRLGFDVEESLSLAHVYVHIGSLKHALTLGNILNAQETRDAEEEIRELPGESAYHTPGKRKRKDAEESVVGSSQPWVGLLKTKMQVYLSLSLLTNSPVIERPDGTWRAIEKGVAVEPSAAYLYITRALRNNTPFVMGAMQLVAESYSPEQLDTVGLALYNDFKPDVVNWGQRGSVSIAKILEQIKTPVDKQPEGATGSASEETPAEETEKKETSEPMTPKKMEVPATPRKIEVSPPAKRAKLDTDGMSLEEYEAMLDVDFEEGLYDFY